MLARRARVLTDCRPEARPAEQGVGRDVRRQWTFRRRDHPARSLEKRAIVIVYDTRCTYYDVDCVNSLALPLCRWS